MKFNPDKCRYNDICIYLFFCAGIFQQRSYINCRVVLSGPSWPESSLTVSLLGRQMYQRLMEL